jgi:hypothetical protein
MHGFSEAARPKSSKIFLLIKFFERNSHPLDSQHLAGSPPFLPIPDPKVLSVKPNSDGLNLALVGDKAGEHFEGFSGIKGTEIREDLFQIDFDQHLDLPPLLFCPG